jgi:phage tail-like protein
MVDMGIGRQSALPADKRKETLSAATFKIENQGGSAVFSELAGISSEVELAEYMEVGDKGPMFGRFVGRAKPPTVSLKRAMTTGQDTTWVWAWHALARTGASEAYRDTTLSFFGAGSDPTKPLKMYSMINAVAQRVEIGGMKAGGTEVVIATLTIQCDEIVEAP